MNTLHENSNNSSQNVTPEGGQREFLCSNKRLDRCSPLGVSVEETFTQEGLENIIGLAKILKRIHVRLIAEGYTIKDGRIYKQ